MRACVQLHRQRTERDQRACTHAHNYIDREQKEASVHHQRYPADHSISYMENISLKVYLR